jgi:DNA modification methylase
MSAGGACILEGDVLDRLAEMPDESVNCVVTSPPYWGLRDYGADGQIGLEESLDEHIAKMVAVFAEVRRVLRADGVMWLNYGDAYASTLRVEGGHDFVDGGKKRLSEQKGTVWASNLSSGIKPKNLLGLPWRVAFALQADGWYLRSDVIWAKPNPMPESCTDRPTKSHEYVFLMTKSAKYWYDADAVREAFEGSTKDRRRSSNFKKIGSQDDKFGSHNRGAEIIKANENGRNIRTVWTIPTEAMPDAHFATFPQKLAHRCILAGCPIGGTVLDPFSGSGTTVYVAAKNNRNGIGIELNPEYVEISRRRLSGDLFIDLVIKTAGSSNV